MVLGGTACAQEKHRAAKVQFDKVKGVALTRKADIDGLKAEVRAAQGRSQHIVMGSHKVSHNDNTTDSHNGHTQSHHNRLAHWTARWTHTISP